MSKSNTNPADPFKKALAEATKSLANEPELNVSYTIDPPGISNETIRLPQVSRNLTKEEVKKFKVGYVEKNPNFFKKLQKDFNEKTLIESGVNEINVTKARINSRSDKKATVDLEVISSNGTVFPVIYSMHKNKDDKWLLENVIVFGVNVGLAFRDRFEKQVRKNKGDIDLVIDTWTVNLDLKKPKGA